MASNAKVVVEVVTDTKDATKDVDAAAGKFGKFGKLLKGAAVAGGVVIAGKAIVDFGAQIVGAASQAEQSIGAVESVFGDFAEDVVHNSEEAAEAFGISANEYRELAAVLGSQLKSRGLDEVAAKSDDLISIGADLAATFGGTTEDAVAALGATLRGEFDSAERFGIALSAAAVSAKAVELGLAESTAAVDDNAKATATLALLQEQTADTTGQFAKEQDSLAGITARASAKWDDFQAELGKKVLPVVTKVFGFLLDTAIPAIGKVVDVVGREWPKIYDRYIRPTMEAVQKLIRAVLSVVTALWDTYGERIIHHVQTVFGVVGAVISGIVKTVRGVIDTLSALFRGDWAAVWQGLQTVFSGIWDTLVAAITGLPTLFASIVPLIASAALSAGKAILSGLLAGIGAAGGAIGNFAAAIGNALRGFINDRILGPIRRFTFTISALGFSRTFTPFGGLPSLAQGGITTGPTVALIGDNPGGREAVVPLDRHGGGIGGDTYAITVNAGVGDPVEIGRQVVDAIRLYESAAGRQFASA